jgi:hypothetical protein
MRFCLEVTPARNPSRPYYRCAEAPRRTVGCLREGVRDSDDSYAHCQLNASAVHPDAPFAAEVCRVSAKKPRNPAFRTCL